ncbi:MAG TPA: heparinase [Rhizobiales bacterium]|nr:heparinase II/III-like protein [bacterium BMS3Bbin10]HDO51767.1 heparinase [Hyphomicrobiales bacterium]
MIVDTFSNRVRLTTTAAGRAGRVAWRGLLRSRLLRWRYRGAPIDRLYLTPQDLRTSDPSFASEIYHGHFGLAGVVALLGANSPFAVPPPSAAWMRELHGFGWLRHLHAAHDEISSEQARALVGDWITLHGEMRGLPWDPEITARRIISWLSHATVLMEGADEDFYDALMRSFALQLRYLRSAYRDAPDGLARLTGLIALAFAGLCADEHQPSSFARPKHLAEELKRQILADGGHISRNPAVLIELLHDLLPLRQCFIARDQIPPPELLTAIDRMMPMLRFFRLGDQGFARFNGMGPTPMESLAALMVHDDVQGAPVSHAEKSGYCRLVSAATVILADTGRAPPIGLSADAHAGCLSFEMSTGRHLLIVNCGVPVRDEPEWRAVSRATAAHSTLTVSDTSSSQLVGPGSPATTGHKPWLSGPVNVQARMNVRNAPAELRASHDGYDQSYGITHVRSLRLSDDGTLLEGIDQLIAPHGLKGAARDNNGKFALRFHLHPSARVEASRDGQSALIVLRDNEEWWFTTGQGQLEIEESVFLADIKGPRRTSQIVVYGAMGGATDTSVRWSLERIDAGEPQGAEKDAEPEADAE